MSATLLKALAERAVDAAAHGTRSLVDLPVDVLALVLVQLVDPFLERKFDLHLRGSDALFHSIGRPEPADRWRGGAAGRRRRCPGLVRDHGALRHHPRVGLSNQVLGKK